MSVIGERDSLSKYRVRGFPWSSEIGVECLPSKRALKGRALFPYSRTLCARSNMPGLPSSKSGPVLRESWQVLSDNVFSLWTFPQRGCDIFPSNIRLKGISVCHSPRVERSIEGIFFSMSWAVESTTESSASVNFYPSR